MSDTYNHFNWQVTLTANPGGQLYQASETVSHSLLPQAGWSLSPPNMPCSTADGSYCFYDLSIPVAIPVQALTKYQDASLTLSFSASLGEFAFPDLGVQVDSNPTTIVDPVPDLVNPSGDGVVTDAETLATYGTPVTGVAADSATRVVFRVPANSVGEHLNVQLLNDQGGQSSSAQADGTLATIQGSPSGSQMQLTAVQTSQGPMAFCLYFPPRDFSRGGSDDNAPSRSISLQAASVDNPSYVVSANVTIWRPPVVLVHGLWSNRRTWNNFTPLVDPNDPHQFFVRRADYSQSLGGRISDSFPTYSTSALNKATMAALGFGFNAPQVLWDIDQALNSFRKINQAAVVQADVVAHSMGGTVVRAVQNEPLFAIWTSFGSGKIHKLITIGTPHFGSQLATQLLDNSNRCVRNALAGFHNPSFLTATVDGFPVGGGVGDLQGDGTGTVLSQALIDIERSRNGLRVPTAMIAGKATASNLKGLDSSLVALTVQVACLLDPLAQNLTQQGWPTIFGGQDSDGMVSVTSQVNNLSGVTTSPVVHSAGLTRLGFNGPVELDPDQQTQIPSTVIQLLNAPLNAPSGALVFYNLPLP